MKLLDILPSLESLEGGDSYWFHAETGLPLLETTYRVATRVPPL
jgi:hypothetical protein